ncbi:MAG: LysM peptidoglycan-binding domain-containing protein [Prosthecobacter sp.]|uniref:LysM peptidoglycan-binding domain-containing protein n=1 Tax=Prosthecobacter sp. TaxID=1965333 RepID=UPI002628D2A2|nr:LysM peptidoglycan-binding domain-containing protein [Prosthecobacter sp.]MCF7788492.1 LysM peptidoglycan-binding domain-containing protein [Prosthecobacter sp.]
MAKTQIKLLIFLITVGLVAGTLAMGYWVYMNILLKESQVEHDIASMKAKDRPRIDPGVRRFEAAVELIHQGKINEGRDALYKLCQQFPDSKTCPEAMRIIGEINMDQLYSANSTAGKKDYIVQPGNSLNSIANKYDTTVDSIIRSSGLMSFNLHPGDHLTIIPMDFHLGVSIAKKQVMLLRKVGEKEYLFKVYNAKDIRLPPGMRLPVEMTIAGKNSIFDGKSVLSTDANYLDAEKWFSGKKTNSNTTISIRTPPVARAQPVEEPKTPNSATKKSSTAAAMPAPAPAPTAETGIFLAREDIEELFALVRNGSKLSLVR